MTRFHRLAWAKPLCLYAALACTALSVPAKADNTDPAWLSQIESLVRIQTWRSPDGTNEAEVRQNIAKIKTMLGGWISDYLAENNIKNHTPIPFEWKGGPSDKYWVFGWRVGSGTRRIALLTHMDTVPPGAASDWQHDPFEPGYETRLYNGSKTRFMTGRGTIDDKGPAIVTLHAMLEAIKHLDNDPNALDDITFELLFDTSEETDFSTTKYFEANPEQMDSLQLGIVYDAFWCIRAEKGIERPVFTFENRAMPNKGMWVADFHSATGPANQIPGAATAVIDGAAPDQLAAFAKSVADQYNNFDFGDPTYTKADLDISTNAQNQIVLTTKVAGAQHGSAPQENRAHGANPLVSLGVFLDHLAKTQVLGHNHFTDVAQFMTFGWGTQVFGELHPDLLYRFDSVFTKDNGTTYALSQVKPVSDGDHAGKAISLAMDIRYAIGHHSTGWDGSQGTIKGNSLFSPVFTQLVERFATANPAAKISFTTATLAGPDIRNPSNAFMTKVNDAYKTAMGQNCPMQAIGGGTDAKGRIQLVAAGALFTDSLGPPINFHGIDEGAPIKDLVNGKEIMKALLLNAAKSK